MTMYLKHNAFSVPFIWPDAGNSGCSGPLTDVIPKQFITAPNTTLQDMHFIGGLVIGPTATNTTIYNCKISGGDYFGIEADNSVGLTINHCTVIGLEIAGYNYAISAGIDSTVVHCDVSKHAHAIGPGPGASVVRYNYIHDAFVRPPWRTVTLTISSPCVATLVAHGYSAGQKITFATTGSLPTGVSVTGEYYVSATGLDADTFQFSASPGGAAINTTGTQSGIHSVTLEWDRHVGGVSIKGTGSLVYPWVSTLVEHNMIYAQDTSAVFIKNDFGSVQNVTVNHNKMLTEPGKTGPSYCIQAGDSGPSGTVTGVRVINNIMEKGAFGHIDVDGTTDISVVDNNYSVTYGRIIGRNE